MYKSRPLSLREIPMKVVKYSLRDIKKIDLDNKTIYKYPTPTKHHDISLMVIKGRNPKFPNTFILEHKCQYVAYVTKGEGQFIFKKETIPVTIGDVVFVPKATPFATDGNMEYIAVVMPAFTPEQSEEITL